MSLYLSDIERSGVSYASGRALDFGCGVGRLTQALAEHFEECDGVDIAGPMIDEARRINRHGDRCRYHVNDTANLQLFPSASFDFVLSIIVLQHMEPRYAGAYIAEFLRVLRPGGVAGFQVPATMSTPPPAAQADGAWQAAISLDGKPLRQLRSGDHVPLRVRVRNAGSAAWPPGSRVTLGNHWADRRGRRLPRRARGPSRAAAALVRASGEGE